MFIFYKNKGILVPVFAIVSVIGTFMVIGALSRNVGGAFTKAPMSLGMGIGFTLAAIWTYLVKDDYYRNDQGHKVMMGTENAFFFMSMKVWAYIFLGVALLCIGNSMFNYFVS